MRLVGTILALLFALSLAIAPISGARAAAMHDHHHGAAAHHDHAAAPAAADPAHAGDDCAGHEAPLSKHAGCCDMGACHPFTIVPLATFAYGASLMGSIAERRDDQVRGERSGRIDRPPRPV